MKLLSLIVPVYNEEETISLFVNEVTQFYDKNIDQEKYKFEIVFINDGSTDQTLNILKDLSTPKFDLITVDFSRNFGKENALFAGIENCKGDIIVPIDVDLQDPLIVIADMLVEYEKGFDVVLAKRANRSSDSFLKRKTAEYFYEVYNKIADYKIEPNVGDFRLIDRKVVDEILKLNENQLFMKGLFSWVGFKSTIVEYIREERSKGETKFNFTKLLKLAIDGLTSFSVVPLKIWLFTGVIIAICSILFGVKIVIEKIFFGIAEHGYPSLICAITLLGGIQLISIGVLGEYIGRIYLETKRRPKFIINNVIKKETL